MAKFSIFCYRKNIPKVQAAMQNEVFDGLIKILCTDIYYMRNLVNEERSLSEIVIDYPKCKTINDLFVTEFGKKLYMLGIHNPEKLQNVHKRPDTYKPTTYLKRCEKKKG